MPWHIGDGKAVYMGKTFNAVEARVLLQLWYDFIWGNKISDTEREEQATESSKHKAMSAVWRAHARKGQEYCHWWYQRTYLLIFCLEVILYTWARNLVLSSLKAQTAGCRNAAEDISENTWADRETQGEGRSTSFPSITDKSENRYPQVTVPVPGSWYDSEQAGPPPISTGKGSGMLVNLE